MARNAIFCVRTTSPAKGVRMALSTSADMSNPFFSQRANTVRGVAQPRVTGLVGGQRYYCRPYIDGAYYGPTGSFKALPEGRVSFNAGSFNCTDNASNQVAHTVAHGLDLDFAWYGGDWVYSDIDHAVALAAGQPILQLMEAAYDGQMVQANPRELYHNLTVLHQFDDHEYGDSGDATSAVLGVNNPEKRFAQAAFRNMLPTWSYADTSPGAAVHRSIVVGNVEIFILDCMSTRTPTVAPDDSSKTMLGAAQKAWLKAGMLAAQAAGRAIWIANPKPWQGATDGDGWGDYATERAELGQWFYDNNMLGRMFMTCGDMHSQALDDGTNTNYASSGFGFPLLVNGAMDRAGSTKGGPWSAGTPIASPQGRFGVVRITDTGGSTMGLTLEGRDSTGAIRVTGSFTLTV